MLLFVYTKLIKVSIFKKDHPYIKMVIFSKNVDICIWITGLSRILYLLDRRES